MGPKRKYDIVRRPDSMHTNEMVEWLNGISPNWSLVAAIPDAESELHTRFIFRQDPEEVSTPAAPPVPPQLAFPLHKPTKKHKDLIPPDTIRAGDEVKSGDQWVTVDASYIGHTVTSPGYYRRPIT